MTLRHFLRASAFLWGLTLVVAVAVAVLPGAAAAARDAFGFRLDARGPGSVGEAATYFAANARVVGALLLAAWARSRTTTLVMLLDAVVCAVIAVNAAIVGGAVGAYGPPILGRLLHLPLEWAALALALAAYDAAPDVWRSADVQARSLIVPAWALILAALVESFFSG